MKLELELETLTRIQRLKRYLEGVHFPFPSPSDPERPLEFVDKFRKVRTAYELNHVGTPEQLFFRDSDWRALNGPITVGFGGTVSPTPDGTLVATLLAQVTCQE